MTSERKSGRPTKRSKQVEAAILAALAGGATLRAAANSGGVHVATLCRWAVRYRRLRKALAKAMTDGREARRSQKPVPIG
jgi:transposase